MNMISAANIIIHNRVRNPNFAWAGFYPTFKKNISEGCNNPEPVATYSQNKVVRQKQV
jgi:hypothetical protein